MKSRSITFSCLVVRSIDVADRVCFTDEWWARLFPWSVFGLVFYVGGTFLVVPWVESSGARLRNQMEQTQLVPTRMQMLIWDITFTPYPVFKRDYAYWDAFLFVKKSLVISIITFMSNQPISQAILLIFCYQMFLFQHGLLEPYTNVNMNRLEQIALVGAMFVLQAGVLTYVYDGLDVVYMEFLGLFVILFVCLSAVGMIWYATFSLWASIQDYRFGQRKSQDPKRLRISKYSNKSSIVKTATLNSPLRIT